LRLRILGRMEAIIRMGGSEQDRRAAGDFLAARGMRVVARLGELIDPLDGGILLAEDPDGELVGVLTYRVEGPDVEVSTLYASVRGEGIGTALIEAAEAEARQTGGRRLWLITTNDNVDALRFYQRRGFRLVALRPGGVDDARQRLKPGIGLVGEHGIPIHDELMLAREIEAAADRLKGR
jgi:ribosomal protein S18 acetylase RimI-like enzyme